MPARACTQVCILNDLDLLLVCGTYNKGRDEQDTPGRYDIEFIDFKGQRLVIEIRQTEMQTAIEVLCGGAVLNGLDDLLQLVASKCPALVNELTQDSIAFLLIIIVSSDIRGQTNGGVQDEDIALHGSKMGFRFVERADQ